MTHLDQQDSRKLKSGNLWIVMAIVGLLAISSLLLFVEQNKPPFVHDPELTKTTLPTPMARTPMSLYQKLWCEFFEFKKKRFPNPKTYSFNATGGPSPCSIHGLLNQCMEAGGVQYCIEKNVAAGSVNFGSTNVLNGRQWIDAFEAALQTNKPDWWDPELKGFRHENLVLLRYGNRVTLVLSKAKAREYQKLYPSLKLASESK